MLKKNVLRKNSDFSAIYKRGRSVGDRYVVLFYRPNGLSYNRTGFLASKKVGNSVKRNRAKRLMKESYRAISQSLPAGYDFIIIARNTICGKKCAEVEKSLISAFKRIGVKMKWNWWAIFLKRSWYCWSGFISSAFHLFFRLSADLLPHVLYILYRPLKNTAL